MVMYENAIALIVFRIAINPNKVLKFAKKSYEKPKPTEAKIYA